MSDMVNHPSHYEKNSEGKIKHPECIDLLAALTKGYNGIAALDVGQYKYAYRAGSKADASLSQKSKAIEDFSKIIWYLTDLLNRASETYRSYSLNTPADHNCLLPDQYACHKTDPSRLEARLIANEFIFDKPNNICTDLTRAVILAYNFTTFGELNEAIECFKRIINTLGEENL